MSLIYNTINLPELLKKSKKPLIEYNDIPEITFSQVKALRDKRITSDLDDMENAKWQKFLFQKCVLDIPKKFEQPLWEIYWIGEVVEDEGIGFSHKKDL